MTFNNILLEMSERVKELSRLEKELYEQYSLNKQEDKPGYDDLIEKINSHNGKFFFTLSDLQTHPKIEISPSEIKALSYDKLVLSLDDFCHIKVFEKNTLQQIKNKNEYIKEKEAREKEEKQKEYAKYLELKKEFEDD